MPTDRAIAACLFQRLCALTTSFNTTMASWRAPQASKRLFSSCISLVQRLYPCCTHQGPVLQRQLPVPFHWQEGCHFSVLQCVRIRSRCKMFNTLKFGSKIQGDSLINYTSETMKVSSKLACARCLFDCGTKQRQGFSMSTCGGNQLGVGMRDTSDAHMAPRQDDWALRLANENGFLSWCRNCYLTTVVAIAMLGEGTTVLAEQAAEGAFFVAGLNLTWGTYQYVYNLFHLRRRTGMSAVGVLVYMSMAVLHLALWLVVCSLYFGYTDDHDTKPEGEGGGVSKQGDDV